MIYLHGYVTRRVTCQRRVRSESETNVALFLECNWCPLGFWHSLSFCYSSSSVAELSSPSISAALSSTLDSGTCNARISYAISGWKLWQCRKSRFAAAAHQDPRSRPGFHRYGFDIGLLSCSQAYFCMISRYPFISMHIWCISSRRRRRPG